MNNHMLYCPKCGRTTTKYDKNECYCISCRKTKMTDTSKDYDYFYAKALIGHDIYTVDPEEEIRKEFYYSNPLYDQEADKERQESYRRIEDKNLKATMLRQGGIETENVPKCPTCGSTNIEKISGANKVGQVALFGIFSLGNISKTFTCKNCGMKF